MEVKHYVRFHNYGIFGDEKVVEDEILSRDISNIKIPKNTSYFEVFDRIVGNIKHEGNTYPVKSNEIDLEEYYIGKYLTLNDLKTDDPDLYEELVSNNYCGIIECTYFNKPVLKKDFKTVITHIIDPSNIENDDENERE